MADDITLGIDLGTTFSVAAYVDAAGRPKVLRNAEGEKTTPSAVLIDNGRVEVGSVALNQAIARRGHVIQWIKRSMGDLDYRFQGLGPIEISAEILKKIKSDAETELGVGIRRAVITCPAYFSAIEIESTQLAGEAAGLEVQEIVREPTAAAVYYGVEHLRDGDKVLVCDLGGGTYDASILSLEDDTFKPLATTGDRQLGGHDWTSDLLDHVAELLEETLGEDPRCDPATEQSLYDACERTKRNFAQSEEGVIACVHRGKTAQVRVSRNEFEQLTEWRIRKVLTWTEKVLVKADPPLEWEEIGHVLLVGGSTRLRRLPEALGELTGRIPIQTAEADTMVALGAAILARGACLPPRSGLRKQVSGGLRRIHFARTAPRNLGTRVIVRRDRELAIENSAIIPLHTALPTSRSRSDYQISARGQSFFDIPVVEFDDIGADVIQETWRFDCPPGLPKGTAVHVTFRYDQSGRIDVSAVEQHSRQELGKQKIGYEEPDLKAMSSASTARAVVFTLDVSGSMLSHGKIELSKQAILDTAEKLFEAGSGIRFGVVTFGSRATTICPLTDDTKTLAAAVSRVSVHGSTAMGAGIVQALDLLREAGPEVSRELVLVTDGMPDNGAEALSAAERARSEGVGIRSLGIGDEGIDRAFMEEISPEHLQIDSAEELGQALGSLLTQATPTALAGITWLGDRAT